MLSSSSVGRSDKRCGLSSGSQLEDFKEEHVFLFVFFLIGIAEEETWTLIPKSLCMTL